MAVTKPGPKSGSVGADRISEAHKGSHKHDQLGGFAANNELAREAGKLGGEAVKNKYGTEFYRDIGKKGGETVKRIMGASFYAEIGKLGGEARSKKLKEKQSI